MNTGFDPCSNCTSPMACRDVGMCGNQYAPPHDIKPPSTLISTRMTLTEVVTEVHAHAERAKNWPAHAGFHLERIEKILKDYRKS